MPSLLTNITATKTYMRRMLDALGYDFNVPNYVVEAGSTVNDGLVPWMGLHADWCLRFDGTLDEAMDFLSMNEGLSGTVILFGFTTETPGQPIDAAGNGLAGRSPVMVTIARKSEEMVDILDNLPWTLDDMMDAAMCSLLRPRRTPNVFGLHTVNHRISRHGGSEPDLMTRVLVFDAIRTLRPA